MRVDRGIYLDLEKLLGLTIVCQAVCWRYTFASQIQFRSPLLRAE